MRKITFKILLFLFVGIAGSLQAQTTTDVYYDDFRFYGTSGFTAFDDSALLGTLVENANANTIYTSKLVGANPTDGEAGELGYTRPLNNSGARTDAKDPSKIRFSASTNAGDGTNYKGEAWLVTDAQDISNYLDLSVTFATKNAFEETGGAGAETGTFKVLIKFNYTDGDNPGDVATWTDVTSDVTDVKNSFGNDGVWAISKLDLTNYVTTANSDKFALAFQYKFSDGGTYSTLNNRNGTWEIADVRFQSTTYTETLENSTTAVGSFSNGETYTGDHGFEWTVDGKIQTNRITGNTTRHAYMQFGVNGMTSGTISTGIKSFSATVQEVFNNGTARTVELLINDVSKGTLVMDGNTSTKETFTIRDIDVSGDIIIKLKHSSTTNAIAFDNLSWTSFAVLSTDKNTISDTNVIVYPNPANSIIHIESNNKQISNVQILNLSGQTLYNNSNAASIDVSNFEKGMYMVQITTTDGTTTTSKLLVK
jgi:hypothetical protein